MGESFVVNGAMMTCTFGMAPSSLIVLPVRTKQIGNMPRANIMDFAPMVNIMPFGMCNTLSNPTVASATAAAMGVLTPMPCIPAVTAPWMPGSPQSMIQGQPALTNTSKCICMWGGSIGFTTDGQFPGPPPVITPMANLPFSMPMPGTKLTMDELEELSPEEQEAYQAEMRDAVNAGNADLAAADSLEYIAKDFRKKGDIEKALKAEAAAREYKLRAAQKQASAMNNVNEKYRGNNVEAPQNMSREELEALRDQKKKEYDEQLVNCNKAYAEKQKRSEEFHAADDKLKEANDNMLKVHKPWSEARDAEKDAAKNRATALGEVDKWKAAEASATTDAERDYARQQQDIYSTQAQDWAKKENAARKEKERLQPAMDKASAKQRQAADNYRQKMDAWSEANDKNKAEQAKIDAIWHDEKNAIDALEAQDAMDQHKANVENYYNVKNDAVEKGKAARKLKEQEDSYRDAADKNFTAALEVSDWKDEKTGENPFQDMYYSETARYDQMAADIKPDRIAAEEDYQKAEQDRQEAWQEAWGNDAMFDQYTAQLEYDKAQENLRNKK